MLTRDETLILKHLRVDCRASLARLARKQAIPVSTLFTKVAKLESVIHKYTSLIDFSKLGHGLKVNMLIRARDLDLLADHPNINCLSKINNGYDFFLEAIFDNMKSYTLFIEELDRLDIKPDVFFVVEELKREEFLTKDEHLELFG